jgi:S-formylglutathione hydrolase FrmB
MKKNRAMRFVTVKLCILLITTSVQAGMAIGNGIDTLYIYSSAMDRTIPAAIVLPSTYQVNHDKYPVVYLLHGATGSFNDWLTRFPEDGFLQKLANKHNIIFVMPDGDPFGFYLNSPWNRESQFETHIAKEVVSFIDLNYRTKGYAEGRAISGLSMGGQGALYIAIRNPSVFGAAGSMSGAVSLNIEEWDLPEETIATISREVNKAVGEGNNITSWLIEQSVLNQIEVFTKHQIPMIIDCGTEDFFLEANRQFHKKLTDQSVKHLYKEYSGQHDWNYWHKALPFQIHFFSEFFNNSKK